MQIKKNPRDDDYPDTTGYSDESTTARVPSFDAPGETVSRNRNRDAEAAPESETLAARPARAESVLDADSSFDGRYEAAQDLRILGSLNGEVVCRGLLTVERDASAKAKIQARDAEIRGRLEGDIVCTGRLLLTSTALVSGTIKAASLVIEEGASISGNVQTTPAPMHGEAAQATAAAAEKETPAEGESPARPAGSTRWSSRTREVPSFALVSSEERTPDRN